MNIIGITGGIGSGKSTVTKALLEKNYTVLDADRIAREIVEPGQPALQEIVQAFGPEILDEEGCLRRKDLARQITGDGAKKAQLDAIMFRRIQETVDQRRAKAKEEGQALIFLDAPLLYEAQMEDSVDQVWLVHTDEDIRIQRVMLRDGIDESLVRGYIANQMPEEEKMARATRVLDNNGTPQDLLEQVEKALQEVTR